MFGLSEGVHEAGCEGMGHEECESLFRATVDYWRHWLSKCTYTGRWRETVQRSALALKLMTFEPTGAIVAAPTCSLPEYPGGERNWDYRYVWIRDAAFTVYALLRIGFKEEAGAFMRWLEKRIAELPEGGTLPLMYALEGQPVPPRGGARAPGGLWGRAAGAHRQRGGARPAAVGHLRRAHGRRVPLQQARRAHLV